MSYSSLVRWAGDIAYSSIIVDIIRADVEYRYLVAFGMCKLSVAISCFHAGVRYVFRRDSVVTLLGDRYKRSSFDQYLARQRFGFCSPENGDDIVNDRIHCWLFYLSRLVELAA